MNAEIPHPERIQNIVFGAILIALFVMMCQVFAPFFMLFLWSIMFYVLLSPLHRRLLKKTDLTTPVGKALKHLFAALFAIGTVILILVPLTFVTFQFFQQIVELIRVVKHAVATQPELLRDLTKHATDFLRDMSGGLITMTPDDLKGKLAGMLTTGLQYAFQFSGSVAQNVGNFGFNLMLMLFCLFFFYVDGQYLARLLFHVIPIRKTYLATLVRKFMDTIRNLFAGYIIVALVQATLGYIVYRLFQVDGALVFAVLTFICVFIPMVGGSLVWLPLGIVKIAGGDITGGIFFLIIAGTCISLLDNLLRPIFLQNRIQLHPLIIFFAILGGLSVFGFNGIIMGPLIVILFLTVLDMFLVEHRMEKD